MDPGGEPIMEDGKMFIERRAHPRFQVDFPVKYCFVNDPGEVEAIRDFGKKDVFALIRDISLSGMKVEVKETMKVGDVLAFEIPLPGGAAPILASAEVVWTEGNIGGLHFLIISEEDITALKAYLKKLGFRS
jgi:hypothetical protein